MIQKYEQSFQESAQHFSLIDIIDQIIRTKHHQQMIDNRHQRIFLKYFDYSQQVLDYHHRWAKDILLFAQEKQQMNKLYQMQAIIKSIRQYHIAPILTSTIGQENIIHEIRKWNQAMLQLPQSKTMNTSSSKKYKKYKNIINDSLTISNRNIYKISNLSNDGSSDTLNKITQDLSKMLKDMCIQDDNYKKINVKFSKQLTPSTPNVPKKNLKKKLSTQRISSIRSPQPDKQNSNNLIYQYYPEESWLKKQKKKNSKSNEMKMKKKIKDTETIQNRYQIKKNKLKISKTSSQQKLQFIPLTPKARNSSKIKQFQRQIKSPRYSCKSNRKDSTINKLSKSPNLLAKRKQLKSTIQHKNMQPPKKQKIGKAK